MAVVTPLNNPGGPEGDTVTMAEQLLNTEYPGGPEGDTEHRYRGWKITEYWILNTVLLCMHMRMLEIALSFKVLERLFS